MASIDYGNILSRAWKTTFKHKWLWVYGIVLASLSGLGSGGSGGGSSNSGSKTVPSLKDIPSNITPETGKKLTEVLGASTNIVKEWVSHVPLEVWILLAIVIILLVLYGLVIRILIHSWVTGALIGGLKDAENEKVEVNLSNTTGYGKKFWKKIFLFNLLTMCIGLAIIFGFLFVGGLSILFIGLLHIPLLQVILAILLFLIFILLFIVSIPILIMISIYGERLIVLQGLKAKEAFKKAFSLSKSNVGTTLLMGIIKGFLTTALGCLSTIIFLIVVGIPTVIVAVIEFKDGMHFPSPTSIVIWIVLFFLFIYATILVRGILMVFSYSTWNLFFSEIMKDKKIT